MENNNIIHHLVESAITKNRHKRQVRSARIDYPGYFEVFLGIEIPNIDKYDDLGKLFPKSTVLQVYNDLVLFAFKGMVQKFKPFAPINQRTIKIKVSANPGKV